MSIYDMYGRYISNVYIPTANAFFLIIWCITASIQSYKRINNSLSRAMYISYYVLQWISTVIFLRHFHTYKMYRNIEAIFIRICYHFCRLATMQYALCQCTVQKKKRFSVAIRNIIEYYTTKCLKKLTYKIFIL